jgi:hypothetical protein
MACTHKSRLFGNRWLNVRVALESGPMTDIVGRLKCAITGLWEAQGSHELREITHPGSDGGEQNAQGVLGPLWILCDAHSNELNCSEQSHQEEDKNNRNHHKHPGAHHCESKGCYEHCQKRANKDSDWSFGGETSVARRKGGESSDRRY